MSDEISGFDQLVEQLAFGRQRVKLSSCLGLYLSPETIYIAEMRLVDDGRLSVSHLIRIPIPQDAKTGPGGMMSSMNTDFLTDPSKLSALIRQSMSQIRWGSKNVVVTLSHHFGLLRFFPMPPVDRRFLKSAVSLEAKKYIPIPFATLSYDYQAAPMPPDATGKPRQGVLIAVTQAKNLANINALLDSLDLKLSGLEVAPCSVLRLWNAIEPPSDLQPYVQMHFDGAGVRTLICDRGLPVFFRETFLGGEPTLADQRKVDLAGCLSFAQKQLALGRLSKIKLSGTLASLGPWKDAFAQESGLPTEIQDTARLLSIKGGEWGGYAAIGASARVVAPSPLSIDLAATDRVTDDERQTARDIILVGAAVAGLLALLGLQARLGYNKQARALQRLHVDADVEAAVSIPQRDVEIKLKEMQDQLEQLRGVMGEGRLRLSAVLKDVVELMPQDVWLHKISVRNPLMSSREITEINLIGRARAGAPQDEQQLANQFRDALQRSERVGKSFDVQIALQSKPAETPADGAAGVPPEQNMRRLEERTEFTLQLRTKR